MDGEEDFFLRGRYEQSFSEIYTLKSRLPEASVISLAREVLLRVAEHSAVPATVEEAPSDSDIEVLTSALISQDKDAATEFVSQLRAEGKSLEAVYLSYLAFAARKLGDWWSEDRISLLDVAVGSGRIYAIIRALSDRSQASYQRDQKAAVFATVPGETHTLGIRMAADLCRKNGWEIDLKVGMTHQELVEAIGASSHVVIGISGAGAHSVPNLARLVVALRISNPRSKILISGQIVQEAPDLVELMGVDAMTFDFEEAQREMARLWGETQVARS